MAFIMLKQDSECPFESHLICVALGQFWNPAYRFKYRGVNEIQGGTAGLTGVKAQPGQLPLRPITAGAGIL